MVLADGVAAYVPTAFGGTPEPALGAAWMGALAYTLQLYFDFSGYSDMAIGLSRLFGVDLPLNFNSPYKAGSIIEFWRRWHMTLSRFLRDYLYIPLGGGRAGPARRYANLMVDHAAGRPVARGRLDLRRLGRAPRRLPRRQPSLARHQGATGHPADAHLGRCVGSRAWVLTFLAVVVAWVPFRAANWAQAREVLEGMAGLNGADLMALPDPSALALAWAGSRCSPPSPGWRPTRSRSWPTICRRCAVPPLSLPRGFAWRPSPAFAAACAVAAVVALGHLANVSEFLYFQF